MVTASTWLAIALAAQPATATGPVTVEIVAIGHSDTPATKFVLSVMVTADGTTEELAKANVSKIKAALLQQLAAVGVTPVPEDSKPNSVAMTTMDTLATDGEKPAKPSASDNFAVQSANRAAIVQAQAIIAKTIGASADQPPVSSISDTAAAVRAAKSDAIGKARLDAQAYADALGYSGATVTSVSERGDFGTLFNYAMMKFGGGGMSSRTPPDIFGTPHGDTVPMEVAVTVTFRLDGKK